MTLVPVGRWCSKLWIPTRQRCWWLVENKRFFLSRKRWTCRNFEIAWNALFGHFRRKIVRLHIKLFSNAKQQFVETVWNFLRKTHGRRFRVCLRVLWNGNRQSFYRPYFRVFCQRNVCARFAAYIRLISSRPMNTRAAVPRLRTIINQSFSHSIMDNISFHKTLRTECAASYRRFKRCCF